MEKSVLLRSLTCSSLVCNRIFFRSAHRLRPSTLPLRSSSVSRKLHRLNHSFSRRSLLPRQLKSLPAYSQSCSFHFRKQFSSLAPRAVASPPAHSPPGLTFELHFCFVFQLIPCFTLTQFVKTCFSFMFLLCHSF